VSTAPTLVRIARVCAPRGGTDFIPALRGLYRCFFPAILHPPYPPGQNEPRVRSVGPFGTVLGSVYLPPGLGRPGSPVHVPHVLSDGDLCLSPPEPLKSHPVPRRYHAFLRLLLSSLEPLLQPYLFSNVDFEQYSTTLHLPLSSSTSREPRHILHPPHTFLDLIGSERSG
jgi:hypothetical protein